MLDLQNKRGDNRGVIILAIANQKGGVGKTTTVINLGYGLSTLGRRVLLVDCDPQSSLTQAAGVDTQAGSLTDVLSGHIAMSAIIKPLAPGVDLAPSSLDLANFELILVGKLGRENVIKRALSFQNDKYDICVLDCPPSLGLLTVAALVAANGIIAPTTPDALGLRGLRLFLKSLEAIRSELNPGLDVLGVIVCQYARQLNLHKAALAELRAGDLPVLGIISRSTKAAATAGRGKPIKDGPLFEQYQALALEVEKWLKKKIMA